MGGPNEPHWRNNESFSPPLSRRWDHTFQSEGPSNDLPHPHLVYGPPSSLSSNSNKDSQSWLRGDEFPLHYSTSEGVLSYISSSSPDTFPTQPWTPTTLRGGPIVDDYNPAAVRKPASGPLVSTHSTEGTSTIPLSFGSTSSHSDVSEYEPMSKAHLSSHWNFSNRRSFMSKPVHPLSCPSQTQVEIHGSVPNSNSDQNNENVTRVSYPKSIRMLNDLHGMSCFPELATTQGEGLRWSGASSIDFTDFSEQLEAESMSMLYNISEGFKCGLCERLLSQRSPWSSRRIVRSGDMPVSGVLPCRHVYHAECLEQTTPKMIKHDPPCPLCMKSTEENVPEQRVYRLKNGFPRLRSHGEDGPSRTWSCGQVGDCVEGALYAQARSSMMLLNRSRLKKHLSLKGSSCKIGPDTLKKDRPSSSQSSHGRNLLIKQLGAEDASYSSVKL